MNSRCSVAVGSVLHPPSMKRAIQVLHLNGYNTNCLRRRPIENNATPAEICQWTNHRVMEWLRSVDLVEYAPNLRGSGVYRGLMPRRLLFGSFGTLRQKTQEDMEEYVCPMNVQMPQSGSFHKGIYEDSLDQLEQMEDSEGTVRQIGAFSEEINNLTSMLKEEEFFREASPHSPETSATDDD